MINLSSSSTEAAVGRCIFGLRFTVDVVRRTVCRFLLDTRNCQFIEMFPCGVQGLHSTVWVSAMLQRLDRG